MLVKGLQLDTVILLAFLSVVRKSFQKLVNNRFVDHLEKCVFFSDFQYGFRSSQPSANLLTVVSDRTATAFKIGLLGLLKP